jgi:DNA invertase Pin-like site-specific DNA recombinase
LALADARREASGVRARVDRDQDPAGERQQSRQDIRFRGLAESYLSKHARRHGRVERGRAPTHAQHPSDHRRSACEARQMFVRAYLRASTREQDAQRAKEDLRRFAKAHGLKIAAYYIENESGASLKRPELFRLLEDSHPGDVLLIEQVDRLSRLGAEDWGRLRTELQARQLRVVALDLPTSWMMAKPDDAFTGRMFEALNAMMLDMVAAIARKDYDDRRRRQLQGIVKAKAEGKYRGRPEDKKRNIAIMNMLKRGMSWNSIIEAASGSGKKLSRATLSKLARRVKEAA